MGRKAIPQNRYERKERYVESAHPGRTPDRSKKVFCREYLVVGPKVVGGKKKGEVVKLTLTEGQASALIEAGHVVVHVSVEKDRPLGRDKGKE
jgi:hypothetical protein